MEVAWKPTQQKSWPHARNQVLGRTQKCLGELEKSTQNVPALVLLTA